MELWIRSQDRTQLLKTIGLYYDYQQEKHHITCITENDYYWVGIYKTKERALEVLDEIEEFIDLFNRKGFGNVLSDDGIHSKHTIYQMPEE